jgi:hypothetical protein
MPLIHYNNDVPIVRIDVQVNKIAMPFTTTVRPHKPSIVTVEAYKNDITFVITPLVSGLQGAIYETVDDSSYNNQLFYGFLPENVECAMELTKLRTADLSHFIRAKYVFKFRQIRGTEWNCDGIPAQSGMSGRSGGFTDYPRIVVYTFANAFDPAELPELQKALDKDFVYYNEYRLINLWTLIPDIAIHNIMIDMIDIDYLGEVIKMFDKTKRFTTKNAAAALNSSITAMQRQELLGRLFVGSTIEELLMDNFNTMLLAHEGEIIYDRNNSDIIQIVANDVAKVLIERVYRIFTEDLSIGLNDQMKLIENAQPEYYDECCVICRLEPDDENFTPSDYKYIRCGHFNLHNACRRETLLYGVQGDICPTCRTYNNNAIRIKNVFTKVIGVDFNLLPALESAIHIRILELSLG